MGFATLAIASSGTATLTDLSNSSQAWSGTLTAVSSQSSLFGNNGELTNPCNGLYTMTLTSGSGSSQQQMQIFLGFVPGTTPAVVLSSLTILPNNSPSSTNYQYRYGMGFKTGN